MTSQLGTAAGYTIHGCVRNNLFQARAINDDLYLNNLLYLLEVGTPSTRAINLIAHNVSQRGCSVVSGPKQSPIFVGDSPRLPNRIEPP